MNIELKLSITNDCIIEIKLNSHQSEELDRLKSIFTIGTPTKFQKEKPDRLYYKNI